MMSETDSRDGMTLHVNAGLTAGVHAADTLGSTVWFASWS